MQTYVARLRQVLAAGQERAAPAAVVHRRAGGYALEVSSGQVDASQFTELLRRAREATEVDSRIDLLADALALWRGPAYAGLRSSALEAEATRLDELRMAALEQLWELRLAEGTPGGLGTAIGELEHLVRAHPLHERLWALLAQALYAADRQGDALAALRRARRHLADELGVDPGPELRRVEEAVLRQDLALRPSGAARTPVAVPNGPAPTRAPPTYVELFGRQHQLAAIGDILCAAQSGVGRVVVICGEAGTGKTTLAAAVAADAVARGMLVSRGGWDDEGSPALWAWTQAVRALPGGSDLLQTTDAQATSASMRQSEDLLQAVLAMGPTLLILDDLHWADSDSLRLLRRLAAGVASAPLVVLVTTRIADYQVNAPLDDTLVALSRSLALRVDLTGLDAAAVREWVTTTTGAAVSEASAAHLVERTGGNPFFVAELVRLLVAEDALLDPDAAAWRAVPSTVRQVVRTRLGKLNDTVTAVAGVAATVGRTFDHSVVATAAGLTVDQVDEAVESLLALGLAGESGPGRSYFTHALVRDAIHEALTPSQRARQHAAVGATLERHYGGRVADRAAELAEHYRLAGPDHAREAWLFSRQAAERAGARAAYDEALRLWRGARELQLQDVESTGGEREHVLLGEAGALIGLGRTLEAWNPVAAAARSALERDDVPAAVAALLKITENMVWGWRLFPHHDLEAIALWRRVSEAAPQAGVGRVAVARLMAGLAYECFFLPEAKEESSRLAEIAVRQVREATSDPAERLPVMYLAMIAMLRPDLLDRRMPLHDEMVSVATGVGDAGVLASVLTARAGDRAELGQLERARSDVVRAHRLATEHKLVQQLMVTGWQGAVMLQVESRWEEAEATLQELDAFAETLAVSGSAIGLMQRVFIAELHGRLAEWEERLRDGARHHPLLGDLHLLSLIRGGNLERARRLAGSWSEQTPSPPDYMWTTALTVRSWLWRELGDRSAISDLRRDLTPYAERLVVPSATGTFLGSLHQWVGELADAAGDGYVARQHLEEALRTHRRLELPWWITRTEETLARLD